MNFDLKGGRLL